jgi:long-chain fatty acid transport protein
MTTKLIRQLHVSLLTLLFTAPVLATNGYFLHGTGTKNKGMAGAGIALPEDPIAMANNPAAALATAGMFNAGLAVFSPRRHYTSSSSLVNGHFGAFTIGPNNDIKSGSNYFYVPNIAGSWALGDDSAWGFAFYGKGGMNTDWKGGTATFDPDGPGPAPVMTLPGTYGAKTAGVDFSQAYLDLTYARNAGESITWGASLVVVAQVFAVRGVGTFAPFTESFAASGGTAFPENLSNNGHDLAYGAGGKFGVQIALNENIDFAVSYQSRINMTDFDDYSDLFAEQGGFDIPPDLKAGVTLKSNEDFSMSFDIEHIWYSDIDSIGNSISNIFSCPTAGAGGMVLSNCLGGDTGAGFGWDDMTVFKVGAQWSPDNDWTWRVGYSHGNQPIPESEVLFNILAPGVIEQHVTLGFTRALSSGDEISMSLMYALNHEVTGTNPFDPTQTLSIDMDQFEIEFTYGWR